MSDRDDFEAAIVHFICDGKLQPEFMKTYRVDEQYYLGDPLATGMVNAAWWAWNHQRARYEIQAGGQGHVMH